jgi:hypothetical protein
MNTMNTNQKQPNAEKNKKVDNNGYYKSTDKENEENVKEIQGTQENDKIKDGRNTELYNEKLLKKYRRQHFITIPQTEQNQQQLFDNLIKTSKCIKYLLVAKEKHTAGS